MECTAISNDWFCYINNTNPQNYPVVQNYTANANLNYVTILAHSGSQSQSSTVLINSITIVETAPSPAFTITPSSVSIPCGTSTTQTFTVNNVNNTQGTLSYDWNLGSANNGWIYQGSAAPQTFTTSTNSIQLTSSSTATSLSSVSVTVKINGTNFTTLTSAVTLTTPTYNFSISGPDLICNTADYSIPNLPAGASVSWAINPSAAVLQLSPNTPNINELRITNQKWHGFSTTLIATITGLPCGVTATAAKSIANDNDNSASTTYSYYQEACTFYNVSHPSESGTITSNSSPVFVHQGCMVYVNLGDMTGRTVTFTGSTQPLYWSFGSTFYAQNTLYFQLPLGSGGIPFTFTISGNGACYEKTLLFFSISNNGRYASSGYTFDVAPNPVKNVLKITATKATKESTPKTEKVESRGLQYSINIYDANTNNLVLTQKDVKSSIHSVNVSKLRAGFYILQIIEAGKVQTLKFLKE